MRPIGGPCVWGLAITSIRTALSKSCSACRADALGPDRVWCVMMPSRYTAGESLGDAQDCAERIGCRYDVIAIKPAFDAFQEMLAPLFGDLPFDTTEENMQSRTRALTLMAISNKFGPMVVTTGNKSESRRYSRARA